MKKLGFWKADWFLGLIVVVAMVVASRGDLIQSLERKAYDLGVQAVSRTPSDRIAVIAIDDASIANIGRWPWPRDVQVRMIDLHAGLAAWVSLGIGAVLIGAYFGLMVSQLTWIPLMASTVLLAVGYASLTTKRFLVTERGKEKSEAESTESNRMLGIAYQAQGQLDLAWDKFRQCPLADTLMENLYALALDFERKRQFNKAESVFGYMAEFNPKFRDLEQRSLGVTLYQMLSGSLPFQGDSMAQLMFKIANEPHADIRKLNPGLPACVAAVTNKALAKDPEQRYQTGEQMAKAIRLCLGTLAVTPKTAAPAVATEVH